MEVLCRFQRAVTFYLNYHTLGSPSRTRVSGAGQSEELREKCTPGHAGQCQSRAPRVKVSLYMGTGDIH